MGSEKSRTWPADVLIPNWSLGKPAALDLTVTSLFNAEILSDASKTAGWSAAYAAEQREHGPKCKELGWVCIPLAVEHNGCLGDRKPKANTDLTWIMFSFSAALLQITGYHLTPWQTQYN